MNSNRRLNGHRLLFVIALFGILSTHVISALDEVTTVEPAPDVSEPAGDQSTLLDSAVTTVAETEAEQTAGQTAEQTAEQTAGQTAGQTATSAGESTTGGKEDGVTGGPGGAIGGETTTSAEELRSTGTVSVQVQAESDVTVLDSSTEGTESGTTATFTVAPSTGGTAPKQEYTTVRAAAEDTTASVKQTTETATATSVRHARTEGQTETTEPRKETTEPRKETKVAVISTSASPGYTKSPEKCRDTKVRAKSATWIYSVTIYTAESENKYRVTIVTQNQNNTNQTKTSTRESTLKPDCSTVVNQLREGLRKMLAKKRSNMPSTSSTTTTATTTVGILPNKRKRRQVEDETSDPDTILAPDVDMDIDDHDEVVNEVLDIVTNASSETTSPQSTRSMAESSGASSTTSATLTTASDNKESAKQTPIPVEEQDKLSKPDVWKAHYGLFLTVVILISVCVVVSAVCCLCMAWRRRGQEKHSDKQPIAMEEAREGPAAVSNPIPDAEMIQDEAPMQERENPAVTPNGGGQHISKADEDNGWVVPLDELSKAEKEKPEVENTRL